MKAPAPSVLGLPDLRWLNFVGDADRQGDDLVLRSGPGTDWFHDPGEGAEHRSAPALVFALDHDAQLAAEVAVDFGAAFDAGVLFVHQSDADYAKLCFERAPDGRQMVVSVVTREFSDDANHVVVEGGRVHLRISRTGATFTFHHSSDGRTWDLARLFRLRDPDAPTVVGFLAQSPTGDGCTARFGRIRYSPTSLDDPRDGS